MIKDGSVKMNDPKFKLEWIDPKSIIVEEGNSNVMNPKLKTGLIESIRKDGLLKPLLVDSENILVDGQHRLESLVELKWLKIPIIRSHTQNFVERKQLQLLANRLHGQDNPELLAKTYDLLLDNDKLNETALLLDKNPEGMHLLIEKELDKTIDTLPIQPKAEPISKSKLGQMYQLGQHMLLIGDALDPENIKLLLGDSKPNLLLTDPPYNLKKYSYMDYFIALEQIEIFIMNNDKGHRDILKLCGNHLIDNHIAHFHSLINYGNQALNTHRMIAHLRKGKAQFNNLKDGYGTDHEIILNRTGKVKHAKDLKLFKDFIVHFSKENQIIVDLFGGSAAVLFAAELTNRICYTMELDPVTADYILNEWKKKTGIEPILIR